MLRKLRKRLKERELKKARLLAAALCTTAVLATSPAAAWAATVNITSDTGYSSDTSDDYNVYSPATLIFHDGTHSGNTTIYSSGTLSMRGMTITGVTTVTSGGILNLSGGMVQGATTVTSGGILNLSGGGLGPFSTTTINSGGTLNVNVDTIIFKLNLAGGRVVFAAPSWAGGYRTFSAELSGGGSFCLNANLAAGAANVLTVRSGSSGSYTLYVANTGGTAAAGQTVKVVDLPAGSGVTFSGGGDIGAFRYGVANGSAISGALDGEDYYFYNTGAASTPARTAIGASAAGKVVWYGEMNEIKKRLGDLRMGTQTADDFWVRTYADRFNVRPGGGEKFTQNMRGIELGKDNPRSFDGGKKYTGFVVGTGKADNTFSSGGSGSTNSLYAGAYGSWLRDDGSYFDLVGKYNRFRHSFDSPVLGGGRDSGSYRNTGLGLSAELGKRFERKDGAFIQPEAELSALWSGRASYATANGLAVETPAARSLQLRLGVTAGQKWQGADGTVKQVYAKGGWVNEYKGDSRTVVDGAAFDASLKGHQWVSGLGYIEDNGRHQLYIDVEKSWGDTVSKSWGVNLGCRWKF